MLRRNVRDQLSRLETLETEVIFKNYKRDVPEVIAKRLKQLIEKRYPHLKEEPDES